MMVFRSWLFQTKGFGASLVVLHASPYSGLPCVSCCLHFTSFALAVLPAEAYQAISDVPLLPMAAALPAVVKAAQAKGVPSEF